MENQNLVRQFVVVTSAPKHVAEHVLEAHGWDVDAAVGFYMESGGVGHGDESVATEVLKHSAGGEPKAYQGSRAQPSPIRVGL